MDRRVFLASGVAAAALQGPAAAAVADPFPDILDAFLSLSPEQATTAGLDTGARTGLKHRLDPRDFAHRLRSYDALIDARPALQNARRGASDRFARFLDSAIWVSDIFAGFQRFNYGSVDGYYYPVPFAVTQMSGAYKDVPDFLDVQHSITTRNDAEAYLDRLSDFAKVVEGETALCRDQAAHGIGVAETQFGLGGMHIHIHLLRRQVEPQRHQRVPPMRDHLAIADADRRAQHRIGHRAAIHHQMLPRHRGARD